MSYETTTHRRTITAFFDSRSEAEAAIERLVSAGIERERVSLRGTDSTTSTATRTEEPGFWESLKDLFLPDEDRATYAEGLRRGGYLVTAQVADEAYPRALDILDHEGTVDLDERTRTWRSEGWSGHAGTSSGTGAAPGTGTGYAAAGSVASAAGTTVPTGSASSGWSATRASDLAGSARTTTLTADNEEVIPVTEEQLRVGKREIEHGRVRVRSYVVETPVTEQVGLREEHVSVERRSVDRPVSAADAVFADRVIEATETAEEAVIAKEARVKEELVIRKTAEERNQTVQDTVRRTEVEVEDERGTTTRTGTVTDLGGRRVS